MIQFYGAPLEVKFLNEVEEGTFEGYASIFGNKDFYGDVVEAGAFKSSISEWMAESGKLPPMYINHGAISGGAHETAGFYSHMEEDAKGLYVKGGLYGLNTERGKWNYAKLKEGGFRGLSIGYRVPPGGSRKGDGKPGSPARYLKRVNLVEVSLVDVPANARATLTSVKSLSDINIREIETGLRDAGLSRADAVKAAAVFKSFIQRDAEDIVEDPRDAVNEEILSALRRLTDTLKR